MLEPGNNEALKIETVRRRTGLIRQYQSMGPVEIVAYMAAHADVFFAGGQITSWLVFCGAYRNCRPGTKVLLE